MHPSETFFPKKKGIDTNPPATKKTSTERKPSPMLVGRGTVGRFPKPQQERCPYTPQGEMKRDEVPPLTPPRD